MPEKNYGRISIRVPERWKREFADRKIKIAPLVRSFLYRTLQTSDKVVEKRTDDRSKLRAASLYNGLTEFFVRTKSVDFDSKITAAAFKTPVFRAEFLPKAQPEELAIIAEFLGQDEFAEEILQEVFK
jgi:hypothetical protein